MESLLRKSLGEGGYQDIRFEDLVLNTIVFKGNKLEDITVSRERGGHARAISGGGWGTFSFSDPEQSRAAVEKALQASSLIPGNMELAEAPVLKKQVHSRPEVDPRGISLSDKKGLLESYNKLILGHKEIQSTEATYYELNRTKYFFNNEGTEIFQEQLLIGMTFRIIGRRGNLTQRTSLAIGGSPHYSYLHNREHLIEDKVRETQALLGADPVRAGNYTVILDPGSTGVFIHEAFGHLSEADNLANNPNLRKVMVLGHSFGPSFLNVLDDPTIPNLPGNFAYDDEGVSGEKTYLIKDGLLSGRLHSRETAWKLGEKPTGNCRAQNYTFAPVVRMTTTFIDNGPHSFENMVASIDNGLYLKGSAGGQTSGEFFTFATQLGYKIEQGKIGPMVRDAVLSGNLFTTLHNIEMIGSDLELNKAGGCGKDSQILRDVGHGAPHVKIRDLAIGGR